MGIDPSHGSDSRKPIPSFHALSRSCLASDTCQQDVVPFGDAATFAFDRTDSFVLNGAIMTMYRWYEQSVSTLALLANPLKLGNLQDSTCLNTLCTKGDPLLRKPYLNDPRHNHKDSPVIDVELGICCLC